MFESLVVSGITLVLILGILFFVILVVFSVLESFGGCLLRIAIVAAILYLLWLVLF